MLSSCLIIGFLISVITMPLYDGLSVGNGITELSPYGIPMNIFSFIIVGLLQSISIFLIYKTKKI